MSSGDPRMVIHSDVAYATNRERIEKMQEFINRANAINEQGKRNYDQISNELKRKIQEGEEAQRMLAALQSSTPLLTYHDSELQPPTSTSNVPLLSFPPTYVSPVPSARIEEVPSPDRHHQPNTQQSNNQQSSSYYQPTYASNYDARFYSGNSNYQPYEQSRPSSHFSNQTAQNAPGSSTLQNALGQHAQAQQSYHLRTAPQQTAESSSRQTYSQPREIIIPQQSQPYSYSQQRDPNVSGVAHSNSGPQTQSRRSAPPASQSYSQQEVHPQAPQPNVQSQVPSQRPPAAQSQFSILSFGAATQLNSQQSQPRQTPPAAASRQSSSAPGMQPPRQSPAPPNPRVETQSQSGPSAPPVWSTHPNLRPQAQPQNQSSLLPTQLHVPSQPQQSVPLAQSDSRSQQREAQPPGAGSQRPEQKENQSSTSKQSLYKPSVVPTAAAPTPSYGISPFAHIPTSIQKANPSVVPSQKPTAPNGQLPKPSSKQAVLAAAAATMTAAQYEGFKVFLNIVNAWQKASPPEAYMDIPHAHIRVDKLPIGEIHFSNSKLRKGPLARLSPATAFLNLQFSGNARIFVNTKGVSMLLQEPLPAAMKPTFPQFEGKPVKDAPEATFPEPPPSTQPGKRVLSNSDSGRSPHDADKRFIAHDILRALGKGHLFAADEESLRYAKRRALEAPEPASSMFVAAPFVPRPVGSNESSAKTTPASSRSPSVASAPQRVPLFLDSSPPPMPIAVSFVKPERRRSPNDRPTSPDFYVLVPAAPAYVRRHQAKIRGEREAKELPVEVEVVEEEKEPEIDVTELKRRRALGMYQTTENEGEAAAMLEACSRLREMPCEWLACGSVLNSFENLVTHLYEVHAQEDEELATCMWDLCGESFLDWKGLALHSETHVLGTIHCAHQDCDQVLHSPRELVAHNLGHAEENRVLQPSARPSAPQEPLSLPDVPESVLTSMVLAPAVQMPHISRDRHMSLGPWVLRNICAPANVRTKRYNAAMPLKDVGVKPDYEFVETSAMHYSCVPSRPARIREMADLNSKEVSDLLEQGKMVLWPPSGAEHQIDAKAADHDEEEMAVESMLQVEYVDTKNVDII